ncbi:probable glutamate--tRNA ligase, mitochondrial [Diorhabda carinulata]|uniref:probable glutamate--tRNA ligase, mitochondrial n=1 Tax=Diorhabda carinulata TaxID=1163345 RepID=UPI0025A29236|nr:probable glutamate--tRNA ligase, mitochondrial [Diorhabda carinulata]
MLFLMKYVSKSILYICIRGYKTETAVRVRFAPSPTGYLHLGGLRTALYNYFFAKKHNGTFILRIEDTDQTRLVPGAVEQLQEDLQWSGIIINEGPTQGGTYGPYLQSERLDIYRKQVKVLLDNGSAYHCFCTDKRLQLLKKESLRKQEIPKYDNKCRHLSKENVQANLESGKPSCIRFKITDQEESFDDLIYGRIAYNISLNEGDPVIVKSDGFPTYHFANVVDDHFMNISHVLRGVEWQISTTKHILLYRAFNWKPPLFGHLPLLMNSDGTKLSKRQGDIKINHFRETGIFPQALINFIVHSGGGFTKDLERNVKPKCYSMEELTQQFDITKINSHSGKVMDERLIQFNKLELHKKINDSNELEKLVREVKELLKVAFPKRVENNSIQLNDDQIRDVLRWSATRISKLSDLVSKKFKFVWFIPTHSTVINDEIETLALLKSRLEKKLDDDMSNVNVLLKEFCQDHGIKYREFMHLLRYVLSGIEEGPSIAEMMSILGKENTIKRLEMYVNKTKV